MDHASSQRFMRVFIVVFVLLMIATAIVSFVVVRRTFGAAALADDDLRVVGWAVLVGADGPDGGFPTSLEALESAPYVTGLTERPATPGAWPVTMTEAGISPIPSAAEWTGRLHEAIDRLDVHVQGDPRLPPTIKAAGRPTHLGVLDEVNQWIRHRADARAEAAVP